MKQNKLLTIIIPAYNAEEYLDRCVGSLLSEKDLLEIIIVNDGSTDQTLKIAKDYEKKYPNSVKVINKHNGGHGSTINFGLKIATGKYMRILDADDWLNEKNIKEYIEILKNSESDIVITSFSSIEAGNNKKTKHIFDKNGLNQKKDISTYNTFVDNSDKINFFSLHTITIKTNVLRKNWGEGLLEKTFYEDQQFVAKCISAANNFSVFQVDLYQYSIGQDNQSTNQKKMFENRKQHERVIFEINNIYKECKNKEKKRILLYRLTKILKTHYWIYFYNSSLTRKEKNEYKTFKRKIKESSPELLKNISPLFKLRLFVGRILKKERRSHERV